MKKLLIQIDTDPIPAVFDTVVGYDGGADHVQAYGGIDPSNAVSYTHLTLPTSDLV